MEIKFLQDVTRPQSMAGKKGQTREIDAEHGRQLIAGGYAEEVKAKTKPVIEK